VKALEKPRKPPKLELEEQETEQPQPQQQEQPTPLPLPPKDLAQRELARYLAQKYGVPESIALAVVTKANLDQRLMKLAEIEQKFRTILGIAEKASSYGPLSKSVVDTAVAKTLTRTLSELDSSSTRRYSIIDEVKDIMLQVEVIKAMKGLFGSDEDEKAMFKEIIEKQNQILEKINNRIEALETRIQMMEQQINNKKKEEENPVITQLAESINELRKEIESLKETKHKEELKELIESLKKEVDERIKALEARAGALPEEPKSFKERIREIKETWEEITRVAGSATGNKQVVPPDIKEDLDKLRESLIALSNEIEKMKNKATFSEALKTIFDNFDKIVALVEKMSPLMGLFGPRPSTTTTKKIPKPPKIGGVK